ncbi:MAG: MobA/MobL family protein [Oscillospiraceae bacterium]|nr:MobA/MobL family protein [Oscillospiraceae bacterium]
MALFHLNVKQIKRSQGQSAIASAAYRAGEKLYSEYYGEVSDYTNKGGVICSEILLPDHAPREYADRQALWNAVEKAERGKKAQLAYSFDIALQNEFSMEENIALARHFLLEHFVSRGMVVDFAIHVPDIEPGGISNPHFHVMSPIRPIDPDGKWGCKQHRVYELDEDGNRLLDAEGNYIFNAVPTTDWGSPETLEFWREQWAAMCNAKFEENGLPERIDHRSYERQGIDLPPTIHEGPAVRQMEAKGIRTDKGEFNRWIKATNALVQEIRKKIAAILDCLKDAREELTKPQSPDLISLLQMYVDQRNSKAYSWKARANNLKELSEIITFLQEHSITDVDTLEAYISEKRTTVDAKKKLLDAQTAELKDLKKLPEYWSTYKQLKPIADGLRDLKFTKAKEKYKKEHASELKQFYAANRMLSKYCPDGKYDSKAIAARYADLEKEHAATYADFTEIREEAQMLWKIRSHIDAALRNQNHTKEEIQMNKKETNAIE